MGPGSGIDFASIGGVLGLIYLAVLLVTLGPAWRASLLPPAEAVRYTEWDSAALRSSSGSLW